MSHALDAEQPRSDPGPTVLVVDDEPGLADLHAAWVGERYTAHVAYGGEEAVEMLDDGIDVVLLDRRMADLPGEAVVAEIDERELECCVAMVTVVEPDVGVTEMGVQDYLTKPVSQDELLGVVESLWDRQR